MHIKQIHQVVTTPIPVDIYLVLQTNIPVNFAEKVHFFFRNPVVHYRIHNSRHSAYESCYRPHKCLFTIHFNIISLWCYNFQPRQPAPLCLNSHANKEECKLTVQTQLYL
jgi:hypothetical protein